MLSIKNGGKICDCLLSPPLLCNPDLPLKIVATIFVVCYMCIVFNDQHKLKAT
jgi:hypothetical protein